VEQAVLPHLVVREALEQVLRLTELVELDQTVAQEAQFMLADL
jgi:hypothetical protein